MQDRIQFYERYAVQPHLAMSATGAPGTGAAGSEGTFTARGSRLHRGDDHSTGGGSGGGGGVPINEPSYSRTTSSRAAHATSVASLFGPDPSGRYGSTLGSGANTDRSARGGSGGGFAGAGAPAAVRRKRRGDGGGAAPPPQSAAVGFGSSTVKDTSLAPVVSSGSVTDRAHAVRDAAAAGTTHSQRQFGAGATTDLPPFLSPATAAQPRGASGSTSTHLTTTTGGRQALGGRILEGSASHSHRWTHVTSGSGQVLSNDDVPGAEQESLTMGEHCALVNEALAHKTSELLRAYRSKLGREAALLAEDFYFAASAERAELTSLIDGYHAKLSSLSTQFESLASTRARVHKLRLSNASLRLLNLDAARNYDARLGDMRLEVALLSEEVHATPGQQVTGLEKAIAAKETERRQLEREVAQAQADVAEQRPRLEAALAAALEQKASLSEQLRSFEARKAQDYASQREEIAALQDRIGKQVLANTGLQAQLDKRKRSNAALQAALDETRRSLDAARGAYDAEVGSGLRALDALHADLQSKSQAFLAQFLAVQAATELCAALDQRVKVDLLCRTCMQLLEDPVILWPCGHTLCRRCVSTTDSLAAAANEAAAKGAAPLPPLPNWDGAQGLVCTECAYNFQHPLAAGRGDDDDEDDGEDEDDEDEDMGGRGSVASSSRPSRRRRPGAGGAAASQSALTDDPSFPNPFFDPPPHFKGVFHCVPNMALTKVLQAYGAAQATLGNMLPRFTRIAQAKEAMARFEAARRAAATMSSGGDGMAAPGSHLEQLLSEAEQRVDRGEMLRAPSRGLK